MRFAPLTIRERGQIAQAMAQVHQHRKPDQDVTGRIACTRCGATLSFTVQRDGHSRGACAAAGCVRWSN